MIELELPEPQFEDLTLHNIDAARGKGPAGAEVPAALAGRVAVDGPHGFKLSADRIAADPGLGAYVDERSG